MELVEGPTLASVIAGSPDMRLALSRVLEIAGQIANGLEAAHEKGMSSRPKARQRRADAQGRRQDPGFRRGQEPRPAERSRAPVATDVGVVLGNPAYMSPKQARGLAVDRRTDVWAFGCLLYELLTGRKPFAGSTPADTVAALLTQEPNLTIGSPDTPAAVRSLLRDCLKKNPEGRPADMAAARLAISEALSRLNQTLDSTQAARTSRLVSSDGAGGQGPRSRTQGPYVGCRRWPSCCA